MQFENIYMYYNLDIPSAERIKMSEKMDSLNLGYSGKETLYTNVFWICNNQFTPVSGKNYTKRIFLFTDNDNPHFGNESERKAISNMITLFNEQDTALELFPLKNQLGKFEINNYFSDIIYIPTDEANMGAADISDKIFDLSKRMRAKEYHKRTLASLLLQLNEEESVGVKMYHLPYKK